MPLAADRALQAETDTAAQEASAAGQSPRKLIAGRLIVFGAIPIAVFCAFFVLAARVPGRADDAGARPITLSLALAAQHGRASSCSRRFTARTVVGEVEAVRDAVRHVAAGGAQPAICPSSRRRSRI